MLERQTPTHTPTQQPRSLSLSLDLSIPPRENRSSRSLRSMASGSSNHSSPYSLASTCALCFLCRVSEPHWPALVRTATQLEAPATDVNGRFGRGYKSRVQRVSTNTTWPKTLQTQSQKALHTTSLLELIEWHHVGSWNAQARKEPAPAERRITHCRYSHHHARTYLPSCLLLSLKNALSTTNDPI